MEAVVSTEQTHHLEDLYVDQCTPGVRENVSMTGGVLFWANVELAEQIHAPLLSCDGITAVEQICSWFLGLAWSCVTRLEGACEKAFMSCSESPLAAAASIALGWFSAGFFFVADDPGEVHREEQVMQQHGEIKDISKVKNQIRKVLLEGE